MDDGKRNVKIKSKKKEKKKFLTMIIFFVICAGIGAIAGILSETYLKEFMDSHFKGDNVLMQIGLFLSFIIGYLIHIIVHEAGHLIFGLMTGYSFVSFRVGSLTLIKEDGKFKFKRYNIPGTAGQCLMMPPNLKDGKYPFIIYNLGGAMMNVIVSILGILLVVSVKEIIFPLDAILILASVGGIFAAVSNAIPMKLGGIANDGYNILSMIKDEEARRGFYVNLRVNGLQSKGVRIKDMPLEMVNLKEGADIKNPLNTAIKLMEYSWYLDNMDFSNAKKSIDFFTPYLDKIIPLYKNEINCERIFLELVGNCDKDFIDDLYDKNLKKYIKAAKYMISKKRILMAYEIFYNKDKEEAFKYYDEMKKLAKKYPIKAEIDTELMLLEWIKDTVELSNRNN